MSLGLANPPAPLVRWRGGYPIKTSGSVEILDCPGTADTADHPPQNSPKVPVQRVAIDRSSASTTALISTPDGKGSPLRPMKMSV
jgi:hypothetical protein